ncbi:MAG: adenosylcobinamide-phosphate [Desulfobulbaceae bacterium]|jgi:adenosylcobinamide-phosphate synthase|nr:MAG: adenosylcobinamide-phosphate [Desulfobulbaceae bacterium]
MLVHVFELQLLIALTLDMAWGDPRWFPHPVRIIGWLCVRAESLFRKFFVTMRIAGFMTVLAVIITTLSLLAGLLLTVKQISPLLADGLAVFLLYTSVAARDLVRHSRAVFIALQTEGELGLQAGRQAVSMIVGRDTAALDRNGVIRATVETVAENMVDGICAPLFFAIAGAMMGPIFGCSPIVGAALAALGYKAVNTMDSMFGYKNERYLDFGWAAARLDDICNFIPARLCGLFLAAASFPLGLGWKKSFRIFFRDRLCHASPNSGHSEAAVAGALGVQLGGDAIYFGRTVAKPTMGDQTRALVDTDILITNRLILTGSALVILFLLLCRRIFL